MLLTLPDVLDAQALAQARALLDAATWVDGRTTAGALAAEVKHNEQVDSACAQSQALQQLVLGALERHPLFFSAALPKRILPPMFNRYAGAANTYGDHVDQAIRYAPRSGQRVRCDLSCTLFLSDPADHDGGELVIHDVLGPQRVKLPAGHLVLYPADRLHRVEPVTRGMRRASFFWVESMVRRDDQRALLFDLDLALIQLRQRDDVAKEAMALTGTYHRLLRMWADT